MPRPPARGVRRSDRKLLPEVNGTYRLGPLAAGQATIVASSKAGHAALMSMAPGNALRQWAIITLAAHERKRGVNLVVEE